MADEDRSTRTYAAFSASSSDVAGLDEESRGPNPDVMDQKLQDAIGTLLDPAAQELVHRAAVDQVMEALYMSNLVILPTLGVPEADPTISTHGIAMQQAIGALNLHIDPLGPGTELSKADAWEARNFIQVFQEAAAVIGQTTALCDPQDLRGPGCGPLLAGDEGGTDIDDIYPEFARQVRSPFFIGGSGTVIQEQVIVPDVIALNECVVVLKEIQGVKAVVRKVLVPIWVEPWNARAAIVGFKVVWVWEFIPAEFLKTISYCNVGGSVVQDGQHRRGAGTGVAALLELPGQKRTTFAVGCGRLGDTCDPTGGPIRAVLGGPRSGTDLASKMTAGRLRRWASLGPGTSWILMGRMEA